jgi:peptidoglycan/LPS O-acetylase OafA/YrhL
MGSETTSGHIRQLDGVRGLAITMVVAFHASIVFTTTSEIPYLAYRVLTFGWAGVDLFFVLSGFLITGILVDSRGCSSYFRTFYIRRVLRIFPLYFAYLFLILVLFRYLWRWYSGEDLWQWTNPWWFITYLMNWKPSGPHRDPFMGHLWSLAIEEQFYFVWPAVVWLVPRNKLSLTCALVALGALVTRCWMSAAGVSAAVIYDRTPCRLDCLAVGAFVAVGVRDFRPFLDRWAPRVFAASAAGFLVVEALSPKPVWANLPMRTAGASLLALCFGGVVFRSATSHTGWMHGFFSSRLLCQLGKYSYGIYVLHEVLSEFTVSFVRNLSSGHLAPALVLGLKYFYLPALLAGTFALAWLSWNFLEQPFLQLKSRVPYGGRPAASAVP